MLGSWFSQLAVTAAALTAVAVVLVVRAGRRAHRAEAGGLARRVRVVEAATAVALAAVAGAALLGASVPGATTIAALLGGSVLAWAPFRTTWTVGAVVAWACGTAASAAWLAWLVERVAASGSVADTLLFAGLGPLAVWGLVGLRGPAQVWLGSRGSVGGAGEHALPARRTLLALGAAVVPALVAATVVGAGLPPMTPASQQGSGTSGGTSRPGTDEGDRAQDSTRTEVPGESSGPGSPDGSSLPPGSTPADGTTGSSSGPDESPTAGGEQTPTAPPTTGAPDPDGTPSVTESPSAAPTEEETKTPGYEKDRPNRPSDAPSPGGGRPPG